MEWQTKTVAQFVAATVPVSKGQKNKLLESAQKISLFPKGSESKAATDSKKGEPEVGSYERLLSFVGQAKIQTD